MKISLYLGSGCATKPLKQLKTKKLSCLITSAHRHYAQNQTDWNSGQEQEWTQQCLPFSRYLSLSDRTNSHFMSLAQRSQLLRATQNCLEA